MSEVRLIVRDAQHDIHANRHGSIAHAIVAALSAEPETLAELDVALERFSAPREQGHFAGFSPGINDEPWDAGLVVVDLAARLVVCDSTYFAASRDGYISYHNGKCATDFDVRYHLSDDWELSREAHGWGRVAEARRRERRTAPLDVRAVLYGKPLLEFLARGSFESFSSVPLAPDDESQASRTARHEEYDRNRQIHARWMVEPRDDLRGQAPRDVMLAKHGHLSWDAQDRCEQWSMMNECPRGLDLDSTAYRFGGFGTHELVVYYDMVRFLLLSCRESLAAMTEGGNPRAISVGDFLTTEVPRLARMLEKWLDTPDPEFSGRVPRSLIERERARLPEGMSGHDAVIDCDCPLCAMQADLPGPVFWHLDGCNMDEDFAFSFHRTRAEWEAEQREYEERSRRFAELQAERERLGVSYPGGGWADPEYVWKRSFFAPETPGQPAVFRLFAIGSQLAELIVDLKMPTEARELIDRLNRDFGNLREVSPSSDFATADSLIEPVLDRFDETLEDVASARPDLESKCADLQSRLQRFLEPPSDEPATELFDDELPF